MDDAQWTLLEILTEQPMLSLYRHGGTAGESLYIQWRIRKIDRPDISSFGYVINKLFNKNWARESDGLVYITITGLWMLHLYMREHPEVHPTIEE